MFSGKIRRTKKNRRTTLYFYFMPKQEKGNRNNICYLRDLHPNLKSPPFPARVHKFISSNFISVVWWQTDKEAVSNKQFTGPQHVLSELLLSIIKKQLKQRHAGGWQHISSWWTRGAHLRQTFAALDSSIVIRKK